MKKQFLILGILLSTFTIGKAQNISFIDENFKQGLLDNGVDTGNDGEISIAEAEATTELILISKSIENVSGIEYFVNLTNLQLTINDITEIDVTKNINLRSLALGENNLTKIDLTKNTKLWHLQLSGQNFENSTIDISKNVALQTLQINNSNLTELDVTNNPLLRTLYATNNDLTEINLTNNPSLDTFYAGYNNLTDIDLTNNTSLRDLRIYSNNNISELDVRNCVIETLYINDNSSLKNVYLTGQPLEFPYSSDYIIRLENSPNLELICVDPEYINDINSALEAENLTNVIVSSDCNEDNTPLEYSDVLTLFPNPTTGILNVEPTGTDFIPVFSTIYPVSGGFPIFVAHTGAPLDVSSLANGTYIITTSNATGEYYMTQFVKI